VAQCLHNVLAKVRRCRWMSRPACRRRRDWVPAGRWNGGRVWRRAADMHYDHRGRGSDGGVALRGPSLGERPVAAGLASALLLPVLPGWLRDVSMP
jgi:hypothetical protein